MSNNDLTANSNKFEASYQNGKYGFMINNTFYEIGGGSMPELDFANPLHTFTIDDTWTSTKDCYICGGLHSRSQGETVNLIINDTIVANTNGGPQYGGTDIYIAPLKIKSGDVVKITAPTYPTLQRVALHAYDVIV